MGVRERREREKKEQRQRILEAALEIITKEGFAALSMRKLAEAIEYSAASIYLYFESREQIARELSELGFEQLLTLLAAAVAMPDAIEALHALGAAYVSYGLQNPQMYRLIFMGDFDFMTAAFGKQETDTAGRRAYEALTRLTKRLQDAGVLRQAPLVEATELIWMTLHGIVSLQITCVGLQLAPPENLVRLATSTLVGQAVTVAAVAGHKQSGKARKAKKRKKASR